MIKEMTIINEENNDNISPIERVISITFVVDTSEELEKIQKAVFKELSKESKDKDLY